MLLSSYRILSVKLEVFFDDLQSRFHCFHLLYRRYAVLIVGEAATIEDDMEERFDLYVLKKSYM